MKYLLQLTMIILIVIFILGMFIVIGSPMAKADDCETQFIDSINKECVNDYFRCIAWSDLKEAIEAAIK